jgi:hypothetical protein
VLVAAPGFVHAQETDRVVLVNGNVLDGEVLSMSRGKLEFDTDAMNVVSVDWDDIVQLSSIHIFEVTDVTGHLYYGELSFSDLERVLVVTLGDETVRLPFSVVVELRNLAESFWAKTSGFVDLGINLARANDLRSTLLKSRYGYNGRIWEVDVTGEKYSQSQTSRGNAGATDTKDETSRSSLTLEGRRNISGTWAGTTSGQTEANEELSLERRILFSAGARYNIIRNQGLELYAGGSAVFNAERFTGQERTETGEAKLTLGLDMFDVGDVDFYVLTETFLTRRLARYRINVDARIAWEIVDDFTIGATAVERFDSNPANGAERRDFQYGLTVGWTWG